MLTDTQKQLVEENMGLVSFVAKMLGIYDKDVLQEGYMALMKCVQNYKENLGFQFSTYAISNIKWVMLKANKEEKEGLIKQPRRNKKRTNYIPIEENDFVDISSYFIPYNDITDGLVIEDFLKMLKQKERYIISLKNIGYGTQEIANIFNVSRQYISKMLMDIRKKCEEYFQENESY